MNELIYDKKNNARGFHINYAGAHGMLLEYADVALANYRPIHIQPQL